MLSLFPVSKIGSYVRYYPYSNDDNIIRYMFDVKTGILEIYQRDYESFKNKCEANLFKDEISIVLNNIRYKIQSQYNCKVNNIHTFY
jgi:hypothetical protein